MFCRFCGSALLDDSSFCHSCGKALPSAPATPAPIVGAAPATAPTPSPTVPRERESSATGRIVVGILLIVAVIWWASTRTQSGSSPTIFRQIVAQPRTLTLSSGEFAVNATEYRYTRFVVPEGATAVHIEGTFSASGGFGNDVETYIFSNDDFVNWQNLHSARTFYNSGKVTQGTLDVTLPATGGTYYLVFNNRFSLLSAKTVQSGVRLHYL